MYQKKVGCHVIQTNGKAFRRYWINSAVEGLATHCCAPDLNYCAPDPLVVLLTKTTVLLTETAALLTKTAVFLTKTAALLTNCCVTHMLCF